MLTRLFALLPLLALASASPIQKRETARLIRLGSDSGQCISVSGGRAAQASGGINDGTGVVVLRCGSASTWDISKGSGSIVVSGSDYSLDIGLNPSNNGALKIWRSYPGAPQQTWYLTDDNRIAQTGGNQCLDFGENGLQTYECTTGNTNQVFEVRFLPTDTSSVNPAPSSTSSGAPSPSSTPFDVLPNVPKSEPFSDVSGTGVRIRPVGRPDLCVGVTNGYAGVGSAVAITACYPDSSVWAGLQLWDLNSDRYGGTHTVQLKNHPELCLDAGNEPANGSGMKVWTCGDNYPQQQWSFNAGPVPLQFKTANNQCLDIQKESSPRLSKPYQSYADMQTWECSTNGDPYQAFNIEYFVSTNSS